MRGFLSLTYLIALFGLLSFYISARADTMNRYQYTQYHMGVDVRITLYALNQDVAERASHAAFERFAELDTIMSDYRPSSELMQLCIKAVGKPVHVSDDLFIVLQRSQQVADWSLGAFDITCGPLVALWRKARKTHELPSKQQIEAAVALVGWRNIRIDQRAHTVSLKLSSMKLDLGGIAKGYADDEAQKVLRQFGVKSAMIEAGGDIVVTDPPPGQTGWKILVPNYTSGLDQKVLTFSNTAVSTSGDTEQFVVIGGKRYSHIVDPRSGQALTDRIEVTIVAPAGLTSDGLSTAVSVLGRVAGKALVHRYPGVKAFIKNETQARAVSPHPNPSPGRSFLTGRGANA